MTQATETDLKEIKDLINKLDSKVDRVYSQMDSKFEQVNGKFEQVNDKFEQVNDKLNDMKVDIATLKEGQNGLNQRIDKLDAQNSRVFTGIITAMIITLIAGLIKWVAPSFT